MTIQEFLNFFNGIYADYDGAYGDQCFDLVNNYSRWIGAQRFTGENAFEIYNQAGSFYTQIPNSPSAVPQKGDIVVWSGNFNAGAGHTGVATGKGDINTFEVLEQNDPLNSNCHLKTYNYFAVLGWLRPKTLPLDLQVQLSESNMDRDANWNIVSAVGNALGMSPDPNDKKATTETFSKAILGLKKQLKECQNSLLQSSTSLPNPPSGTFDASSLTVSGLVSLLLKKIFG